VNLQRLEKIPQGEAQLAPMADLGSEAPDTVMVETVSICWRNAEGA
jgi:hypothetical protein